MTDNDEVEYNGFLKHYGIKKRSGRYPWGSGENPHQRAASFFDELEKQRKAGLTPSQIAEGWELNTTELRALVSIANAARKAGDIARAERLKAEGHSNVEVGKMMGKGESYIRSLLAPGAKDKSDRLQALSDQLRKEVDEKGPIDVGIGVEYRMNVSKERLSTAVAILREEGYELHNVQVPGAKGNKTTVKVLAPPGTTYRDLVSNIGQIKLTGSYTDDGGKSFSDILPPLAINPKRLQVKYQEDGGDKADGVIYVRPGKKDLDMGGSNYAQVRIAVGSGNGSHFIKGMAVYKDDLPDGVDLVFHTNKKRADLGDDKMAALKPIKTIKKTGEPDLENPFGSAVRQIKVFDKDGNEKVTSALNLVNEAGDWDKWSRNLSTQFLSKQKPSLAKEQLALTRADKKAEFDEIKSLTNPAVRRKLLDSLADDVDSSAVHMKAKALPRQRSQVIMPVPDMPENKIYAPNFLNGERVVLIRYPHGGIFEIPELEVNNRHPGAKALLKDAVDAVGISHKVAERLSGADFDGDTVLVIPNNDGKIKNAPALQALKDFNPQETYRGYEGMPKMSERTKGIEMGKISNLITDMTIAGASPSGDELARAVRHSMVVIDAAKHNLNYKQSAIDNGISALKKKYQGNGEDAKAGAATLISRARSDIRVPERIARPAAKGGPVDPATGRKVFEDTNASYTNAKGQTVQRKTTVKRLEYADDAHDLVSKNATVIERIYADHSNSLKALANDARKEALHTPTIKREPSAARAYSRQVEQLDAKLNMALRNKPLERQARIIADAEVRMRKEAEPGMEKAEIKKLESMALKGARRRVGADKVTIHIEDDEWEAIQAGAISNKKLKDILDNADLERVKALATPRIKPVLPAARLTQAKAMLANGATQAEVAAALGVGLTTLKESLKGEVDG